MAAAAHGIGDDVHVRTWPSPRVISRRPARLIAPSWGRGGVRRPEHTGSLIGSPPLLGQQGKSARVRPGPAQRLRTDRLVARVDSTGGGSGCRRRGESTSPGRNSDGRWGRGTPGAVYTGL